MEKHGDWWFRDRRARKSRRIGEAEDSPLLSYAEHVAVVRAIHQCSGISTLAELSAWLSQDLDSLLHHRGWVCGLGSLRPDGFAATHWLASPGLDAHLSSAQSTTKTVTSPLLSGWLEHRRPRVYVRAHDADITVASDDMFAAREIDNALLHCQRDPENKWSSVVSFVNMESRIDMHEGPGRRHCLLLEILMPHLHATLCRVIAPAILDQGQALNQPIKLTTREIEILRQIRLGRTNGEIAESLHKSVFTVNNQVVKVLEKLSAKNRTHAVFVAKDMGLLES